MPPRSPSTPSRRHRSPAPSTSRARWSHKEEEWLIARVSHPASVLRLRADFPTWKAIAVELKKQKVLAARWYILENIVKSKAVLRAEGEGEEFLIKVEKTATARHRMRLLL